MKRIFCILLALCLPAILAAKASDAFTVVLMVKNEATVICQTLDPYVQAGLQSFLIFDTGSTDDTMQVVEDYFRRHNIQHWCIFQEPFVDFEVSRNRALDLAEEEFPDATFFLMPDAEWYLCNVQGLINFCNDHLNDPTECYLIRIANGTIDFRTSRLIRSGVAARFVGDVHEVIVAKTYEKAPADIYFELGASRVGIEKSRQRWHRDKDKLLARFEKNPEDPRTTFYLAQTYECLEEFEKAYEYYLIRCQQQGWIEETFEAFYRLGRVTEHLSKTDKKYTWQMAQEYYFAAYGLMPHRAEPLVKLAEHYWPDGEGPINAPLCYLYAKRAYELNYPEHDVLFINPDAYNFKRYELLSKSAWHVGDYQLGEISTRKALETVEMPYLLRNLACYMEAVRSRAAAAIA
jgi:glycosyltransferase involved in cell wall biosynthesis